MVLRSHRTSELKKKKTTTREDEGPVRWAEKTWLKVLFVNLL
jgi:hypothetical protein